MFKSMKRIIKWAGKYKGRLYLGSVFSFFSSLSTVTTWSCGLYRNPRLCERLAGRTRILLRVDRTAKFSKLSDLCIIIFIRFDITLLGLL